MPCPKDPNALIGSALTKIFGTSNERVIKRLMPTVASINALEPAMRDLSDAELRAKGDYYDVPEDGLLRFDTFPAKGAGSS